ncbi:MAG TPA: secretin N-terminal domain-containing protein [Candidatus Elarobacter sp.]|nr:secretin N-terminal domain-containing protein [Candidatus Elarobacter sp.]
MRPSARSRSLRLVAVAALVALGASGVPPSARAAPRAPAPSPVPAVLQVQIIGAQRAAEVLRGLFPRDRIGVDRAANALVVVAPPDDVAAMRGVLQGIDVRGPLRATSDAVQLHTADPAAVANRIRRLYRGARIEPAPNRTLLIEATPADLAQIKALIAAIDAPPATPSPAAAPVEAVRVTKASPRDVARAVANQFRGVRASVAGQSVVLGGAPDEVARAKALIALIDQPRAGVRYTQIYRLRYVDAHSVGDLIARSFHDAQITTDASLNALSVLATQEQHQRIADALAQLDASGTAALAPGGPPVLQTGGSESALGGTGGIEVVSLRAAAPGLNGAPSSSATDIATTVTQAMQGQAPDLRITVPPNGTQLVLTGSPYAIRQAKALIDQLDVEQKLVVLDTEILEVDETAAKNLGLSFTSPTVGTTFTETTPASPDLGTPPPFIKFQPLTRTPISFGITLNLLVQSGKGRVLADPRITTISGRTATIRAGDNIAILTTTGGGTGTVATTQLQTFQTGVTLDITPVVNAGNFITVALHPTVNSLAGIANGIPQIATRDTQTTVAMREDETLVIGGLIQDTTTRNETKIPLLGDLPLLGRAFRNEELNHQRNELIITVTPHIVTPGSPAAWPGPALPALPTPAPLPTIPPGTTLPRARPRTPSPAPPPTQSVQPPSSATAATPPARSTFPPAAQPGAPPAAGSPSAGNATPPPDTFVFGQAPASNAAGPNDPVRIYALTFAPTTVRSGTPVRFSAITSANATKLTIGYPGFETSIAPTAPGRWESAYNFSAAGLASGPARLTVTASRADGAATSAQIPITVVP